MLAWYVRQAAKHALAEVPSTLREPSGLRRRHRWVREAEAWPRERVQDEQVRYLDRILSWAGRHVPFYREHRAKVLPLRTVEDLQNWPVVDRAIVSRRIGEFHSDGFPRWRIREGATTGRSGVPLRVRWEWPGALWWEKAFCGRLFSWARLPGGVRHVILRGGLVHGPGRPESRWRQIVPHQHALVLSAFQLSHDTIELYVRAMAQFRPRALLAYPSAAALFARLAQEHDLAVPSLDAVLTSSELLLPEDRVMIESVFGAPVTDFYGHAERAVAAAQCEHGSYHVFDDYGYVEILDASGGPVTPGSVGEIVATGFHNRAMPFIRYRTGDRAAVADGCCPCGRAFRIITVLEGRPPECLVTRDGKPIGLRLGLGSTELAGIEQLRFFQSAPGAVEIRYVGVDDPALPARLMKALRIRTGEAIHYRLVRVDSLPPGPGGKSVLIDRGGATR